MSDDPLARAATPPLDYGAIGNGRVLALVAPTSAIDWLCLPRFDSPSVFGRLLDACDGGTLRVLYGGRELRGHLAYIRNTNVLRTEFEADGQAWEVIDFAPRIPQPLGVGVPIEITRLIRPLRGQPRIVVDVDLRPDYGRAPSHVVETGDGFDVFGATTRVHVSTNVPVPYLLCRREFVLNRPVFVTVTHGARPEAAALTEVLHDLDLTIAGWRVWTKTCALPGFRPEAVLRSALCLKLHAYHDTGAIIAAATTSIPEALGTARTWDYRYCWLRDAVFVVEALRRLSHLGEGERFIMFLRDIAEAGPLQPVYGIDGERHLEERMLPHLRGFAGSGHVRIGNSAYLQRQNDLTGELVLCLDTLLRDPRLVHDDPQAFFPLVQRLVEEAITAAPTDDTGIWEFRTMLRPYTFSRAMCWAAIHRGSDVARRLGRPALADRWRRIADEEREIVLGRGFNADLGFFTQSLCGIHPDAANLLLPIVGLLDAQDPRMVSTVRAYEERLLDGGLMLRYRNADDFGATTSAFTVCSFWWAELLALQGRLDDAMRLFDRLLAHANPVGLFSEDVEPETGAQLGNFPQAYTHVGLINAAMTIGDLLEARHGRIRAWT